MKKENQLLSRLMSAVGMSKPEAAAPAEVIEQVIEAVADVVEAPVEAVVEQAVETLTVKLDTTELQTVIADLQAQVDAVKADLGVQLESATSALAEMTGKYEAAVAQLAAIAADKAAAKLAARKAAVEAAIGTEKADALLLATQGLEDAAFDNVVSALVGSVDAEAKTGLFQEVGVTAEADASKIVAESAEMRILKQQYGK